MYISEKAQTANIIATVTEQVVLKEYTSRAFL
jgi:hypothetical protein